MRTCFDDRGDLYSLGLTLLDMCNGMQNRKKTHYEVTYESTEKKFPEHFRQSYPQEAELIEVLTSKVPDSRTCYKEALEIYQAADSL